MSVELQARVYALLAGYQRLADLVHARISAGKADQGTLTPYVEFMLIGGPYDYTHDGPTTINDTLVQIDSWADNYDTARAVNKQAISALLAADSPAVALWVFIEDAGTDLYEEEFRRHRVMSQARIWYPI